MNSAVSFKAKNLKVGDTMVVRAILTEWQVIEKIEFNNSERMVITTESNIHHFSPDERVSILRRKNKV
jgi:hypothetical protein